MQLADAGTPINGFTGGTAFTSCIGYTLNNAPVVTDQVNTTFVSATNAGITLSGTNVTSCAVCACWKLLFGIQICEILNPTNCDNATVSVTVTTATIDAVVDAGTL
jgi:hypothetical protein